MSYRIQEVAHSCLERAPDVEYILRHKLGERYLRVDTEQSKEQERNLGLDVASEAA
jgi:hypothetical protein